MSLVDDKNDTAMAFVFLGGEEGGGLVDGFGFVEPGGVAEGGGDGHIQAAATAGGVGEVDEGELGPVQAGHPGAHGHGFACTGVAHDHTEGGLVDAVVDAGDGLGVASPLKELVGRYGLGERGAGEPEVGGPHVDGGHQRATSPVSVSVVGSRVLSKSSK